MMSRSTLLPIAPRARLLRRLTASLLVPFLSAAMALLALPDRAAAQGTTCERQFKPGACAQFTREQCGLHMYPSSQRDGGCTCDGADANYRVFIPCYWNETANACRADLRKIPWEGSCPLKVASTAPADSLSRTGADVTGPIVFMDATAVCPGGTPNRCYLTDSTQAWNTVHTLYVFGGAKRFLIPSATAAEVKLLGKMIQNYAADLTFYTQEKWRYMGGKVDGRFDCQVYKDKYFPELQGYASDPDINRAFTGFHFPDEPSLLEEAGLKAFPDCLQSAPEFQSKEIFLNLFPLNATRNNIFGSGGAGPVTLAEYNEYVSRMARAVRPTYLSMDFYPFVTSTDLTLQFATNLHTISAHARANGARPVAYLQNFQSPAGTPWERAQVAGLKWMASWALAFGVPELGSFLSHDKPGESGGYEFWGLMDNQNVARDLASLDQKRLGEFIRYIQPALRSYTYKAVIAPFLGLNVAPDSILQSIEGDATRLLVGQYVKPQTQDALVFFARRDKDGTATNRVTFNHWQTVEIFDPATNGWRMIGDAGLKAITLNISGDPGVLYRLTGDLRQPWKYE